VKTAFKFAIDCTPRDERMFRSHAGASRFAWNCAVSDQGFGAARQMLGYKTEREGGTLLVADRWFPSSRTCSACGWRKPSLTLAERTFACESCGHTGDRDVNAARNLLKLAASGAESRNACGGTVRPDPARHVPLKQEPGTPHGGQDRDRRPARDGCGMSTKERSSVTEVTDIASSSSSCA
jgi:hypothetical protein